ncbi:MAG: TolC family outer membrane protein [Alphaproteobacteria bacterium]|nr:TolC family outer membrane protein [Alphaproteobacteria bacterium]
MIKTKTILLCGICLVLSTSLTKAETLFDVLARTYQTSPVLQASQAHLRAVDERVGLAKSSWRPYVGVEGNASYMDQRFRNYPGESDFSYDNDSYDVGIVAKQSIFSGFKTVSAVDAAESSVLMERENVRQTEQDVLLNAAIATVDVVQTRALLDLQKNQETVLERHYKSYQKRFKVGELTKTDVAQSEARLKGATAARIGAEGTLDTAIASYVSVVGRKPATKIELNDLTPFIPESLDDAVDSMKKNNPSLKAAQKALEVSEYNIDLQKGDLMPSLDVMAGAGYQWGQPIPQIDDDYDGSYWRVGATLSVPLYQGGGEYAKVREAKQLENEARIKLVQVERELTKNVTQAWETYQTTKAGMEAIKAQIKASKMALDGVIREADVGSRTVLDVLDAEQEYLNYRVNLVSAERNMIVASLYLLSAMGKMTADTLNLNVDRYALDAYYDKVQNKVIGTGI